jgi:Terminase large subunit, T4likevirus-type, N-terminal/Terminase RNaseH-like domain
MLEISRPDIHGEFLIERKAAERFIKLPIKPYLKLLKVRDPSSGAYTTAWDQTNRPQFALINAINDPKYRFVCAALARRLGKTYISNIIAQLVMLVPECNVLIMSPNFSLSSISFEIQRSLITSFDLEVERDNLKDKVIELSNGSSVRMGSLSTVDSSVGRSYNLIIFDEAALGADGKEAFNISLRPTLDRPGSKAIFISTPRGKNNWFSEFFQRGYSADYPDWCSIKADYSENSRMLESDVAEARRSMSRNEFEQEYMANFSVYEGQIYELEDAILDFSMSDGCEFLAGMDPGFRDPTAFIVIAYVPTGDYFHIVDEYLESERTTPEHAVFFKEMIGTWGVDAIFIDSAAPQFASDLAYIHDIPTIKAKKDVLPGIAYVQGLFQQKRLKIDPRCVKTLAALDQYQWDQRETLLKEKPNHKDSHIPDAIRYALYTFTI